MATSYQIESTADEALLCTGDYPATLSQAEYDKLQQAIRVIDALWYLEESYDVLLQNAIELETEVARQAASQRANITSFRDEVDLEVRLLNRRLINFLASVRAFVDSGQSRLSGAGEPLRSKLHDFKAFFSEQFDAAFSYRLMDALRNHIQHRAAAIRQSLTMTRTWRSGSGESMQVLSVSPQFERAAHHLQDQPQAGLPREGDLRARLRADESVPVLARELFAAHAEEYAQLQAQIAEVDAKLMAWHKADESSRRLAKIPGVGPIGAALLMMKTPAPEMFRSGRQFAAWIGLTPKDHSTAGKVRLGVITRAGDEALRSVLVVGATAVIQYVRRGGRGSPWIVDLLKRKPPKLAAVALANKMARIAWKLMVTGNSYAAKSAPAALMGAA